MDNNKKGRAQGHSFGDILQEVVSCGKIIALIAVIFGLAAFIATKLFAAETFTSQATILVQATDAAGDQVSNVRELASSRTVIENAANRAGDSRGYEALLGLLTVSNPGQSDYVVISVEDRDPFKARALADAISETVCAEAETILPVGTAASLLERASMPTGPSGPRTAATIAFCAVFGALAALIGVLLHFASDDRIRTVSDAEKSLHIPVLAVVPQDAALFRADADGADTKR